MNQSYFPNSEETFFFRFWPEIWQIDNKRIHRREWSAFATVVTSEELKIFHCERQGSDPKIKGLLSEVSSGKNHQNKLIAKNPDRK